LGIILQFIESNLNIIKRRIIDRWLY